MFTCITNVLIFIKGKIVTRGAMKTHQLALHSPGTIYCRDCFKVFGNTDELHSHRKQCKSKLKKEESNKESPCHVCGKILASRRGMQTILLIDPWSLFSYLISNFMLSY